MHAHRIFDLSGKRDGIHRQEVGRRDQHTKKARAALRSSRGAAVAPGGHSAQRSQKLAQWPHLYDHCGGKSRGQHPRATNMAPETSESLRVEQAFDAQGRGRGRRVARA